MEVQELLVALSTLAALAYLFKVFVLPELRRSSGIDVPVSRLVRRRPPPERPCCSGEGNTRTARGD